MRVVLRLQKSVVEVVIGCLCIKDDALYSSFFHSRILAGNIAQEGYCRRVESYDYITQQSEILLPNHRKILSEFFHYIIALGI